MVDSIYNKQGVWPEIMGQVMWEKLGDMGKLWVDIYIYIFHFFLSQLNVLVWNI